MGLHCRRDRVCNTRHSLLRGDPIRQPAFGCIPPSERGGGFEIVRRLGNHNMPRATIRFDPGIPEWVASDALSDSRRCTRIGAKPHEYKKKTGGLSCPKFGW
jgi:hypothetical protein